MGNAWSLKVCDQRSDNQRIIKLQRTSRLPSTIFLPERCAPCTTTYNWPEIFRKKLLLINFLANKPVIPNRYFVLWKEESSLNVDKLSSLGTDEGHTGLRHHSSEHNRHGRLNQPGEFLTTIRNLYQHTVKISSVSLKRKNGT